MRVSQIPGTKLTVILGVAAMAGSIVACSATTSPSGSSPAVSASAVASSAPTDAGTPLVDRLEAEIEVSGSPDYPQAGFGSIWVLAPDDPLQTGEGTPNLVRIDPATNEVVATIPVPDRLCQGFVVAPDAVWVCTADALVRVDPTTNEITTSVPIKSQQTFYQLASGGGAVWALASTKMLTDTVVRLDPATESTTTFQMSGSVGTLAYGFDALWLTIPAEGKVVRLDPASGDARVVASGLPTPRVVAAGSQSLWVSVHGGQEDHAGPGDPQVVRIDPISGEVLAEIVIGDDGGPQYGVELWAGEGGVLVRSSRPWLVRIDESTNEIVDRISSGLAIQGPVTFGFGSIWTVNIERPVVYRIAP